MFEQKFRRSNNIFFQNDIYPTENLKNAILWQSDKIYGHQTTVNRARKFAKNQENLDMLQWAPSYSGGKSVHFEATTG